MTVDALRIRRTRRAVYGPRVVATAGIALVAVGALGLALLHDATPASQPAPPPGLSVPRSFVLVDAAAHVYNGTDLAHPDAATGRRIGTVIGAAAAASGGMWFADRNGHVAAAMAPSLGSAALGPHAARVVGIVATASGAGYRLLTADGQVYAFGAPGQGSVPLADRTVPFVGIAAAPADGYWIVRVDGRVFGFGAPSLGSPTLARGAARVVAITASLDGRGYWIATADGHVYAFGVAARGDLSQFPLRSRVVSIAASSNDGYWLATADGQVHAFGAPEVTNSSQRAKAPIVAILTS